MWSRNHVPPEISGKYQNFLQLFSTGEYVDIDPYLHYEIREHRKLNEKYFVNIANYKIKGWKKLSPNLWMATIYIQLANGEDGEICYHFIGMIDGDWKIMLGAHQVPSDLREGMDLSSYVPENALPIDVEIIPLN